MNKLILSILFIIFLNIEVYATEAITPSFDCKKAGTKVEKMICSNPELAKKDKELNELYNKYIEFISTNLPDYKDIIIKAQRNWIKERNKITDMNELLSFYDDILLHSYREAYEPSFYPAPMSSYKYEDVVFYWMYMPLSFYFKNGYVKDTKNSSRYILYSNDEICQNLLSYKVLDFKDFKDRAEVITKYYDESKDGTLQETSSEAMSAENTYITKYANGYLGIDNGYYSVSFRHIKKNNKGYYVPYIEITYYDSIYKSLPKDLIWANIVRMQQDTPLDDGVSSYKHAVNTLDIPVIYNNKVYIQELTVLDNIEYSGINYNQEPPVYNKAVVIKVESPLTRIFSYDNDGSKKLACVYTENKNNLNKKFESYLHKYSDFKGNSFLLDYIDKPIKFLDYF